MATDLAGALLSLGIISQEQRAAAAAVPDRDARTFLGKLVVAGVDADELMSAAADIAGIPLAPADLLRRAYVVDAVPPASVTALRDRLALPVGQDVDGVVDVVIAEPDTAHELAALGLPRSRVYLGAERVLASLVDSVLPLRRESMHDSGLALNPSQGSASPSSSSSASPTSTTAGAAREKAEAAARVAAQVARAGASAALTALKEHGAPAGMALLDKTAETSGAIARHVVDKTRGRERKVAAGAGALLLVVVVVAIVVKCNTGGVNQVEVKQKAALAEAMASRDKGEVAWAIAGFSRVVDLAPGSPLALQALYERAVVEANDGDRGNAAIDFKMLITDPNVDTELLSRARAAQARLSQQ